MVAYGGLLEILHLDLKKLDSRSTFLLGIWAKMFSNCVREYIINIVCFFTVTYGINDQQRRKKHEMRIVNMDRQAPNITI